MSNDSSSSIEVEVDERRVAVEKRVAEKQTVEDDIRDMLADLEEQAVHTSVAMDPSRHLVDYTWEEMEDMYKKHLAKEAEVKIEPKEWRPDPASTIKDLVKPHYDISIPEPTFLEFYSVESDDYSTESDEPPPRDRMYPFRMRHDDLNQYTSDYWQTREEVKRLRIGNELAIITTLTVMQDLDYDNEEVSYGIVDCGGLETLLNLVMLNHITIQISTGRVLYKLTQHKIIRNVMIDQGVPQVFFRLLAHYHPEVIVLASEILLKLSEMKLFRPLVRRTMGLEVMLEVAELPDEYYSKPDNLLVYGDLEKKTYTAGKNCLQAIKNAHCSKLVRVALYKLGFVRLLRKLIRSSNEFFVKISTEMLYEASSIRLYLDIFVMEGFMKFVYDAYLKTTQDSDQAVMMLKTIYKCLEDESCRTCLLELGLVENLCEKLNKLIVSSPRKQLKYTLACLVKFLKIKKYRKMMNQPETVANLLQLFKHNNARVREYSGRMVAELSRYHKNHETLIGEQHLGLTWLLDMCENLLDYDLLAHVYKIVMELSYEQEVFWWVADRLEVIPLLWAAVNNPEPRCIEYGCSALAPYIGPIPCSEDMVRRVTGGLFDLVELMNHEDDGAKAGAITLLSRIAYDDENLSILVQIGFIDKLFFLAKKAQHPRLRYAIGLAFGACAHDLTWSFRLGKRGAVQVLVEWLFNDDDMYVQLGVITGLWKLSYEKINCMVLIKYQIAERVMEIMAFDNECLHNSVAGLLTNMRRLAREAEYMKNIDEPLPYEPILGYSKDVDLVRPYQYPDIELQTAENLEI